MSSCLTNACSVTAGTLDTHGNSHQQFALDFSPKSPSSTAEEQARKRTHSPDICRRKHGGNAESEAANERVQAHKAKDQERVLVFVRACGHHGTTSKEVARAFGVQLNAISGRFSELAKDRMIFDSKRPRVEGCRVWVANQAWCAGSAEQQQ